MDSDSYALPAKQSPCRAAGRRTLLPRLMLFAGIVALSGAESAAAANKSGLLTNHRVSAKVALPAHAKPGAAIVGQLKPGAVETGKLDIPLPDGRTVTAVQSHVTRDDRNGTVIWTGSVSGSPGDQVVLAQHKGTVAGFIRYKSRTFEIRSTRAGGALLFEVVTPSLTLDDAVPVPVDQSTSRSKTSIGPGSRLATDLGPVFQDLLVVYTPAAMAEQGQATLESMVLAAVASANASYRDSGVNLTASLVGLQPVAITEGQTSRETLNSLKVNAEVGALRDRLGADLVLLITGAIDSWCGMAFIMGSNDSLFASSAFGVVRSGCLGSRTLTHEMGHIQGLAHDRETGGSPGVFPYARGYRRCPADSSVFDSSAFYDIMAYPCGPSTDLSTFSSPNIFHQGYPTGVAYELDPVNAADAARALKETAATVAGFRATVAIPPIAPALLTASPMSGRHVSLAWIYSGTTAAGFRVERSGDGVNYVEIASIGAASRSHEDLTATPDKTYSYRVAAYNSAGLSEYSNLATVMTPAVPRAPSGLTATAIQGGQVKLEWIDNANIETGFRVERSTEGTSFNEIASVSANVGSHVDQAVSPSTTYRYRVVAYSNAGPSEYSNTATITTPDLPLAPSALTANAVSGRQVDLIWTDNASNESGFRIERSVNGVNFTQIASAGMDVRSYTDRTVVSDTTYYYRVAAHNGGGVSAYSNKVMVRTPVAAPQLPVTFSVTNNRRKTALVQFTPSPGAPVANYELMRETLKKKQWRYPTTVFSMTLSAPYSTTDYSGKGTFRYSIRACNAAGCTAYSTPVTVKVTK